MNKTVAKSLYFPLFFLRFFFPVFLPPLLLLSELYVFLQYLFPTAQFQERPSLFLVKLRLPSRDFLATPSFEAGHSPFLRDVDATLSQCVFSLAPKDNGNVLSAVRVVSLLSWHPRLFFFFLPGMYWPFPPKDSPLVCRNLSQQSSFSGKRAPLPLFKISQIQSMLFLCFLYLFFSLVAEPFVSTLNAAPILFKIVKYILFFVGSSPYPLICFVMLSL